jgi:hypothetical protein
MASFLDSNTIASFTGALQNHFDTFTQNRTRLITIYKEPIKTFATQRPNPIYGYGSESAISSVTYTPVTGIFPAMITYNLDQKIERLEDLRNAFSEGEVRIKVESNARNFIEDGRKNEKFEFDGKSYNQITDDGVQNYMGLVFYVYKLKRTK